MFWRSLLIAAWVGLLALAAGARTAPQATGPVVVLRVEGPIGEVTAEYVQRGIDYAAQHKASAVLLELSTPGGLDTSMRSIIQHIYASPAPVIGYVAPSGARSASAGFYILLSCDVAAMAPSTNTGAAHPVVLGGAQPDAIEAAKIQSDAAAFIRTIAAERHRNVDLAVKGVLDSQSFTEQEALSGNLIDLVAPTQAELLSMLDGRTVTRSDGRKQTLALRGAPVFEFPMSLRERVLDMDASLAFGLLIVGLLLLYLEFSHPGAVVPGVAGIILVVIALFALSLLPIRGAGAGLLIVGLGLFVLEAKFPSHGVLAAGGVVAMAMGGILLVDAPVPEMGVGYSMAIGAAVGFGIVTTLLLRLVMQARRHRVTTGEQGLIGEVGVARTPLAPEGTVLVHGELWHACAAVAIAEGDGVRVTAVRGLKLRVEPEITDAPNPH